LVRRGVEYVYRPGDAAAVHGEIDCLVRDEAGKWDLVFWETEPVAAREECWQRRLAGMVLAACALEEQNRAWPRSVALVFVQEADWLVRPAARLPHREVLERGSEGLAGPAGQRVGSHKQRARIR